MSSTIKVNNISNLAGDNSGIDLSTNDQIILKTNGTSAVTVNSSQATALGGNLTIPNGGLIGSAGDADAMSIATNGVVTFSQPPVGAGGGKVLQVVEGRRTTQFAFTSTGYIDVGLTVAITPSSTSSKILVNFFTSNYITNSYIVTTINRSHSGSTNVNLEPTSTQGLVQQHSAGGSQGVPTSLMVLDVPNTTDAVTYTVRMKSPAGAQAYMGINNAPSIIVAQEIGA